MQFLVEEALKARLDLDDAAREQELARKAAVTAAEQRAADALKRAREIRG